MSTHHVSQNTELHYYEGDQSKLYSDLLLHHSDVHSEESKKQVKRIWRVAIILTIITIVEVAIGIMAIDADHGWKITRNIVFLILTLVKAGFIVDYFMHLGDEKKILRLSVLTPLVLFVWFIIAFLAEGNHWLNYNDLFMSIFIAK